MRRETTRVEEDEIVGPFLCQIYWNIIIHSTIWPTGGGGVWFKSNRNILKLQKKKIIPVGEQNLGTNIHFSCTQGNREKYFRHAVCT